MTVQELDWRGLRNGDVLARATGQFDVFLTADQNLRYQQNLDALPVAVAVLAARSNRMQDLRPLIPRLLASLETLEPRTLVQIGA